MGSSNSREATEILEQKKLSEQRIARVFLPTLKHLEDDLKDDLEDDHDFLCEGYSSKRARMPCGHTVTAESLTDWCEEQLKQGKCQFECGVCTEQWSFEDVSDIVPDKEQSFDEHLFKNTFKNLQAKQCPSCKCYALRKDTRDLSVHCPRCTAQKGRPYEFCWQCLREWKGRARFADTCENDGCKNDALEILRTCKNIVFKDVRGVTGCPSVRACPTCGHLVEHSSDNCKNVKCPNPNCKQFCFVCLKLTKECLETSSYYDPCSSGVAPRQTSIPRGN